jgi:hypothetical protein
MRRHALNILHEGGGILEDVVIDALQEVAYWYACLMEDGAIRVVNMAVAARRSAVEFARDLEMAHHGAEVVIFAHH